MKILIAGEGGQGVQIAAEILTYAAFLEGKRASLIPNFGVEQRGGVSLAFIVIGDEALYPKFEKADILAIFCDRAIERTNRYISENTKIIYGPSVKKLHLPGGVISIEDRGLPSQVWNVLVLGEIVKISNIVSLESLKKSLEIKFEKKFSQKPELRNENLKAISYA